MGEALQAPAESQRARESYGVLVGWSHHAFNGKLDLRLQRVQSMQSVDQDDVESHHFVMTESQAVLLANYLNQVLENRPAHRRKGWLAKWFG